MKALLRASLAVLSTTVVGCVPQVTTRTPLSDAHRQAIRSSRIVANVGEGALEATHEESNGGAAAGASFGLLGAVVGAVIDAGVSKHRANTANAAVAPVQAVLAGFEPSSVAQATLQRELAGIRILQPAKVEVWHEPSLGRTRVATVLDQGETDAVLVIDLRYRLSLKLDHLVVGAIVAIYPTKAASADELRTLASSPSINDLQPCPALYRNAFVTSVPAPPGPGVSGWTMDGGVAARLAIEGGLAEIARMLAWDLEQGGPSGSSYAVPGAKLVERREFGLPLQWHPATTRGSRTWLRAPGGELASIGDTYPSFAESGTARLAAASPPPRVDEPVTVTAELPDPAPGGGLTFSFATPKLTKQGGAVKQQAFSQRPGDVFFFQKPVVVDGMLELDGQLGAGKGSSWATLGAVWDIQPRSAPFNATKFRSVTVRLASTTRFLRLRMIGDDRAAAETGCYPVFQQEVSEEPTDYTIPLAKFAPEPQCGARGKEIGETLPRLLAIEVTSTRITERPVKIRLGPTTLRP